jgi:hypothetical protein
MGNHAHLTAVENESRDEGLTMHKGNLPVTDNVRSKRAVAHLGDPMRERHHTHGLRCESRRNRKPSEERIEYGQRR